MEDDSLKAHIDLEALTTGDSEAFTTFYNEYYPRIFWYLMGQLRGDVDMAEDLTQHTFTSVYSRFSDLENPLPMETPTSYIFATARNRLLNHFRDTRKRNDTYTVDEEWEFSQGGNVAVSAEHESFPLLMYQHIMGLLEEDEQLLLQLKLEGHSNQEIAQELGLSEGATKTRYYRIKLKIRDEL